MNKNNLAKKWQVNVYSIYSKECEVDHYRKQLDALFKRIAWLYKLDYTKEENPPVLHEPDLNLEEPRTDKFEHDLFYFRSSERTQASAKDFRSLVNGMLGKELSPFFEGAEIFSQLVCIQKFYPFPGSYIPHFALRSHS